MANRLVDASHYSSDNIQDRRDKVVQAREKLKANNAKKRGELDESKLFLEFRTEVGKMNNFVAEKRKLVREDSFQLRAFLVGLLHHATSDHGCAARWSGTASPPV